MPKNVSETLNDRNNWNYLNDIGYQYLQGYQYVPIHSFQLVISRIVESLAFLVI